MAYPARYADIKAIMNRHFALRGVGSLFMERLSWDG